MSEDELLTGDEVAVRLKAKPRFVRRLVAERRIAFVKVGRLVRFTPDAVREFIASNQVEPVDRGELLRQWRRAG